MEPGTRKRVRERLQENDEQITRAERAIGETAETPFRAQAYREIQAFRDRLDFEVGRDLAKFCTFLRFLRFKLVRVSSE